MMWNAAEKSGTRTLSVLGRAEELGHTIFI
jgi:hypothetical protein